MRLGLHCNIAWGLHGLKDGEFCAAVSNPNKLGIAIQQPSGDALLFAELFHRNTICCIADALLPIDGTQQLFPLERLHSLHTFINELSAKQHHVVR